MAQNFWPTDFEQKTCFFGVSKCVLARGNRFRITEKVLFFAPAARQKYVFLRFIIDPDFEDFGWGAIDPPYFEADLDRRGVNDFVLS